MDTFILNLLSHYSVQPTKTVIVVINLQLYNSISDLQLSINTPIVEIVTFSSTRSLTASHFTITGLSSKTKLSIKVIALDTV